MQDYYCGIDIGTTNLKVLVCDENGNVEGHAACPTPRHNRADDHLTNPRDILLTLQDLLEDAWSQTGGQGRLAAISSAGVGEDGFLVGPKLEPRDFSIPWYDRRAEREAEYLAEACDVIDRSGIAFDATRTAAKWLWSERHGRPSQADERWVALTDWPLIAWTGQPIITEALAARTGCWDILRHSWINEAIRFSCAPSLPMVRPTGAVIGCLEPDSFPVRIGAADSGTAAVCGGHDHPIAAAAIRAANPGAIVDSLGTAELIHAEAAIRLSIVEGLVRTVPTGPDMVSACLHVFELGRHLFELPADLLKAELRDDGPVEDMAPKVRTQLETAAMVAAAVLERMDAAGVPQGELFVTGGRARSDKLMQLRADVLGRPVHRMEEDELCALGAAIVAASGVDVRIDPPLVTRTFTPDLETSTRYSVERERRKSEITYLLLNGPR